MNEQQKRKLVDLLNETSKSIAEIEDPYTEDRLFWVVDALKNLTKIVAILADAEVKNENNV